ncbi:ABC transporter B family member 3 [Capsicum annuum]|uniref:ABC transporter B family member 3 n=1 Tax=Capsicum annuum TaxID=4072 RepID=A0A2G3A7F8_CAPAN|nr:ABC transporter B family member 3 [Capsicum annuum]PHT90157.1 ABC transporter B family member 3 [Capsicum annuum]
MAYAFTVKQGLVSGIGLGGVLLILLSTYRLAIWYGSKLIIEKGYHGGDVINVLMAIMMSGMSLGQTTPSLNAFAAGQAAANKLFETINRKPLIDTSDMSGLVLADIEGEIELKDVYFRYPSRLDVQIFSGFSLVVPSGTTVALVGQSGSGKSTIIGLLERFYDPEAGEVLLDGINLKKYQLKWLRQQMGLVSPEPILFATTIKENISYGKENATEEEIRAAIEIANAANFIEQLPQGLDTKVGEHGTQLSGGQKQRLAIARAILKNPKILLLDEATSALDAESERIVQEALEKVMAKRTTVVVSHRLTTISNADYIAVLHTGKLLEQGDADDKKDNEQSLGNRKTVPIRRLAELNKPELPYVLLGSLAAIIHGLVMPLFGLLLSAAIKSFFSPPHKLRNESRFWGLMFVGLGVVTLLVVPFQNYLFGVAGGKLIKRIRSLTFKEVIHQEISWFDILQIQGFVQSKLYSAADSKLMNDEASQIANDAIGSIRTTTSFCAEEKVVDMYQKKYEGPTMKGVKIGIVSEAILGFGSCTLYCSVFLALTFAAIGVSQSTTIAPNVNKAKDSIASIFDIFDIKPKIDSSFDVGTTLVVVRGDIEFKHVSYRYATCPDVQIFKDLCLTIPSGKWESGSGKSTVISLIERFYNPESGEIQLDGVEIKQFKLSWLRHRMGLLSKEPVLFNETIRDNIAYSRQGKATEEEIVQAAKSANAHNFISSLPQGYDTSVGERGIQLSRG